MKKIDLIPSRLRQSILGRLQWQRLWVLAFCNLAAGAFVLGDYNDCYLLIAWVACAFASAFVESVVMALLPSLASKIAYVVLLTIYGILILADAFCMCVFGAYINETTLEIISATNFRETQEFADVYFNARNIIVSLAFPIIVIGVSVWLGIHLKHRRGALRTAVMVFVAAGLLLWCITAISYVVAHNGLNIPQMNPVTRVLQSYAAMKKSRNAYKRLAANAPGFEARMGEQQPQIVVIIGESFSRFHSSLYNYDKPTNPELQKLADKGSLVVFSDAVGRSGDTHSAMPRIFSLCSPDTDIATKPMFPMLFKNAGYRSVLLSNQYLEGNDISFLSDVEVSSTMFDSRNNRLYEYDGEMIADLSPDDTPTLYVIHLMGQHYDYDKRYPQDFAIFKAADYPELPGKRAAIVATYDNATLYNDYVVAQIIDRFSDVDCCVIYLSDHGEYVCEASDFYGHGYKTNAENDKYLHELPLLVWMSDTFRVRHPETTERIKTIANRPIDQEEIPHLIIDISGLYTKY